MFNNRDLGILGAGALLAVLCLFLPLSFVGKVVIGFLVLVGFHGAGTAQAGTRPCSAGGLAQATLSLCHADAAVCQPADGRRADRRKRMHPNKKPNAQKKPSALTHRRHPMPIDFAWNEVGIYPLLTALLGVVGVYFAVWLANGGAEELSIWFQ